MTKETTTAARRRAPREPPAREVLSDEDTPGGVRAIADAEFSAVPIDSREFNAVDAAGRSGKFVRRGARDQAPESNCPHGRGVQPSRVSHRSNGRRSIADQAIHGESLAHRAARTQCEQPGSSTCTVLSTPVEGCAGIAVEYCAISGVFRAAITSSARSLSR